MAEMDKIKEQIAKVDEQLVKLLNRRARAAQKLSAIQCGQDPAEADAQQAQTVNQLCESNPGPFPEAGVDAVFREIYSTCRALEEPQTVYFLGPAGTFSHAAATSRFGHAAKHVPMPGLPQVFREVEKHDKAYGVVPIENSSEGVIGQTLDLLLESPLSVSSEAYQLIRQHLMANIPRNKIKRIYSHPQPIAQCRGWLTRNFPDADIQETASTIRGVELAMKEKNAAAIAGSLAAELYPINILEKDIQDRAGNTTRFLIVGHHSGKQTGNDKTSAIFLVKNRVGALYEALLPFREFGINLTKIESRPTKREAWEYAFYIDFEGHQDDPAVKKTLRELEKPAAYIKILGSYPNETRKRRK